MRHCRERVPFVAAACCAPNGLGQVMKDKPWSRTSRIRLAPGRQLQKDAAGRGHFLAGPTGVVQLNESAAAILALCDGTLTREQIIARILPRSKDDSFAVDVREFLNAARRRGWIIEESAKRPHA
jgi:pyrroloquinoline quinone biosynthesis protein D